MQTVAFIQARMTSTRLPGKVLAQLAGEPSIMFMVNRVRQATSLQKIVVVTSNHSSDDELVNVLESNNVSVFRGDLEDVLKRFNCAAALYPAERYVRLTGDCPLIDPAVIDAVVAGLDKPNVDYSSNIDPPTFADGLDVEAFTRNLLNLTERSAKSKEEREHVTMWMRSNLPDEQRYCHKALVNCEHLRITVDYPEDLELVKNIVNALHFVDGAFDQYDILRYLDKNRSDLLNQSYVRNQACQ